MDQNRRVLLSSFMLLTLIFGLNQSTPVFAQSGSTASGITGNVIDEQGGRITGVLITLKNINTNLTREAKSDNDGAYSIPQLPPGNYELTAVAEGFKSLNQVVELDLGTTKLINLTLKIGLTT